MINGICSILIVLSNGAGVVLGLCAALSTPGKLKERHPLFQGLYPAHLCQAEHEAAGGLLRDGVFLQKTRN